MSAERYCADPCSASSLPFWKTKAYVVPPSLRLIRDDAYTGLDETERDTPYFKMLHRLGGLSPLPLPRGFSLTEADAESLSAHISLCYEDERISAAALEAGKARPVHCPALWLAVREDRSGALAASGIAELDPGIREGVLEWIQVSPAFRRRGLGRYLVNELLLRMKNRADFVTVSGRWDNPTHPQALYQSCGFENPVTWHIIQKR